MRDPVSAKEEVLIAPYERRLRLPSPREQTQVLVHARAPICSLVPIIACTASLGKRHRSRHTESSLLQTWLRGENTAAAGNSLLHVESKGQQVDEAEASQQGLLSLCMYVSPAPSRVLNNKFLEQSSNK